MCWLDEEWPILLYLVPNVNNFLVKMSGINRFIDYFIVSGLDVTSGLEPDTLAGE